MREQVPPCVHSSTPLSLRFDAYIRVYGKFEGDQPCIGNRGQDPSRERPMDHHCFPRETMILRTMWIDVALRGDVAPVIFFIVVYETV